jgi:hypothetical protein
MNETLVIVFYILCIIIIIIINKSWNIINHFHFIGYMYTAPSKIILLQNELIKLFLGFFHIIVGSGCRFVFLKKVEYLIEKN